jgi:hypothetical protein
VREKKHLVFKALNVVIQDTGVNENRSKTGENPQLATKSPGKSPGRILDVHMSFRGLVVSVQVAA